MNITANAASLDWRSNNHGVWKALVKDMAPNSSVTFSAGLTGTVAGRQVTVESPSMPTGFMTYTTDDNTAVFGGVLYGAGTVSDSLEAVSGGKTVRMGSVDLGTLDWTYYYAPTEADPYGYTAAPVRMRAAGANNIICAQYPYARHGDKSVYAASNNTFIYLTDSSFIGKTGAEIQTALSGVILYYELAEPTTSTETAQSLTLQTGVNNLALNERDSSFTLDYTGTEFTLPLDSTRKYAFSDNGVKSMLTGSTEQAVTGGQDMLVDVTRMFNGVSADIAAITSWADMAAVMPEYLSNVAYNEGEVVGRSGGVTTAKWNQLIQNGNFADGTTGWHASSASISVSGNILTCSMSVPTSALVSRTLSTVLPAYHTYTLRFRFTGTKSSTLRGILYSQNISGQTNGNKGGVTVVSYTANVPVDVAILITTTALTNRLIIYPCNNSSDFISGDTVTIQNAMLIDLTEIYGAGHEPSTVAEFEADCAKWGKDLTQYQPYDTGTSMGGSATFSGLQGVGTVKDTQDVVTGEKQVKIETASSATLAERNWGSDDINSGGYIRFNVSIPDKAYGVQNVISSLILPYGMPYAVSPDLQAEAISGHVNNNNVYLTIKASKLTGDLTTSNGRRAALQNWITANNFTIVYELAEPMTSTETAQPLTAVQGLNNVHEQNMSITGMPLTMGYTGTDQTIPAESSSKYLARIDGVDSVLENVESIDVTGGVDRVIDLTYMFGAGNEPATAADFYKLFPTWLGYAIPYDKGSLVNFKGTGLKSVGFNLLGNVGRTAGVPQNTASSTSTVRGPFDETKYYTGFTWNNSYYSNYATLVDNTDAQIQVRGSQAYGVAFPVRVIPGMSYVVEGSGQRPRLSFYTYNGTWLKYASSSDPAVAPANAYWMLVIVISSQNGTVYTYTNPCVHLQWSGGRNGDYEPYWDYTRLLPTLTYFEQGMNGRGGVFDEVTQRQAVTRLAEVDMEDLEWTESNGSWTATLSGMKANTAAIVAENGLKPVVSGTTVTVQSDESPTGKLVYELANPSVVTFPEEVNTTAQVSDYGTESVVPANGYELTTAPFLGIVKYQDNYARTITKLPENYQSQNSMDALQLVLGQLLNVTLTSRFDSDAQAYGYTVTGDGVPGLIAAALTALAPVTGLTFRGGTYMPTDGMVALPDPTIQAITTIPASTSSYTLGEGVYSHAPNSVPTYTLPAVEDASVVHTAKLTVKMSASVLTANFRDSAGDAISYEAPTGTVSSGTLVEYVCTYEPLADGWAVSARVVMQTA